MGRGQGVVHLGQRVVSFLAIVVLTWATFGCAKPIEPAVLLSEPTVEPNRLIGQIAEVSPPETLETLKQIIDAYTPQVRILSPRPGEILESTSASVRVQVRGLPLFKDDTWQLGPHLHVFLDDQPYQAVYDPSEPLVLDDLAPGTHTLRVFASRPWHESFKNQGAFDQRTFHVFAPTPQNEVNASAPLLTYSRPQGTYGAEPIMLDFYLTNAPLHLSAQEDAKDDLHDWRIRCTVNGQSFVFDQWQPIYLKGFQPGRNWVQLELIDETGRPIDNRFNNTVRVFDYQPGGTDTLSRLVRGELDLREVASIIDPTYAPPAKPTPVPATTPSPAPSTPTTEVVPSPESEPQQPPTGVEDTADATPKAREKTAKPVPPSLGRPPEQKPLTAPATPEQTNPDVDDAKPNPFLRPSQESPEDEPASLEAVELEPAPVSPPTQDLPQSVTPEAATSPTQDEGVDAAPEPSAVDTPAAAENSQTAEKADQDDDGQALAPDATEVAPSPLATQETPTQPTQPSGAKALVNRFKAWQQQRQSSAPPAPDPADRDPIPVYQVPPVGSMPEASEPLTEPDLPRVMPELIEPYLTEPYLTQPRTETLPVPNPSGAEPLTPNDSVANGDESPDQAPETDSPEQVTPLKTGLQRPYI